MLAGGGGGLLDFMRGLGWVLALCSPGGVVGAKLKCGRLALKSKKLEKPPSSIQITRARQRGNSRYSLVLDAKNEHVTRFQLQSGGREALDDCIYYVGRAKDR